MIFSTGEFVSGQTYSIYADEQLLAEVTATDGVSGNGANGTGTGGGSWNHDGNSPWGDGTKPGKGGMNGDFTRPEKPTGGAAQPTDGAAQQPPAGDGERPTPPDMSGANGNTAA